MLQESILIFSEPLRANLYILEMLYTNSLICVMINFYQIYNIGLFSHKAFIFKQTVITFWSGWKQ